MIQATERSLKQGRMPYAGLGNVCLFCLLGLVCLVGVLLPLYRMAGIWPREVTVATRGTGLVPNQVEEEGCLRGALPYQAAVKELREELSTWMTLLGAFGGFFGLLIPVGGYLLQRQSLKDEGERIREDIREAKRQSAEAENIKTELERLKSVLDGKDRAFWRAIERCFERALMGEALARNTVDQPQYFDIANTLMDVEVLLDTLVLIGDRQDFEKRLFLVKSLIGNIGRKQDKGLQQAFDLIREDGGQERTPLVEGARYRELLGYDSASYQWLKDFFDRFVPGKLK